MRNAFKTTRIYKKYLWTFLTKDKEKFKTFKETGDSRYNYQNKLDKACFRHELAYRDFEDLNRRTAAGKLLLDTAFNIAKNPKFH